MTEYHSAKTVSSEFDPVTLNFPALFAKPDLEYLRHRLVWLFEACLNLETQLAVRGSISGEALTDFQEEVFNTLSYELFPEMDSLIDFLTFGEDTSIVYDSYRCLIATGCELSFIAAEKKERYDKIELAPMLCRAVINLKILIEVLVWNNGLGTGCA